MKWSVETLNRIVDAEVESLTADMRVEPHFPNTTVEMLNMRFAHSFEPHFLDQHCDMRKPRGRSGISRALYVVAVGRRVVIVRAFIKETQKTPRHEIDLALARAKAIL